MRRFATPGETVRISLREFDGSDDWVEVRAALSYRDHIELRAMAVSGAIQTPDGCLLADSAVSALDSYNSPA